MESIKQNIEQIASRIAEEKGFFLIEVNVRGNKNAPVIEVYLDGENNITSDDCAEISRAINQIIEQTDLIKGKYRLDVSSPGIDRPLVYLKQFPKNIGRLFELKFLIGEETLKAKAKLIEVNSEDLSFSKDNGEVIKVKFQNILEAKVLISFS